MRHTFSLSLSVLITALCVSTLLARPPQAPTPPPGYRQGRLGCPCGADCRCTAGECGHPDCPSLHYTVGRPDQAPEAIGDRARLRRAMRLALGRHAPLILWVGEACPPCEARMADCVHCHLHEYQNDQGTIETDPKVIVARPDDQGGFDVLRRINGIPADLVQQARSAIAGRVPVGAACSTCTTGACGSCSSGACVPAPPVPLYQFAAPTSFVPMSGFGGCGPGGCGFGGFGGGGGCASGCCGGR